MQKSKVVVIHNILSPHVAGVFKELAKKVDLTVLYCSEKEDNRSWNKKPEGYKYKILPSFSIKLKGADLFTYFINLSILRELKLIGPKVVIVCGWDLFAYQVAFFYCKLVGIKLIILSGSTKYETSWRRVISMPLVKIFVRGADALIAYGSRAQEYLISLGADKKKIYNYHHSTDVGKIYKSNKNKKKIKRTNLLYYGQLIERKGVSTLIQSFAEVIKEYKNLRLYIVGSGPEEKNLKNMSKNIPSSNIHFFKDPGDQNIGRFFKKADLLILPSLEEVWGLVVNMSLGNGIPVIVSDVVGCGPDLVKEGVNGYVFKAGSSKDLKAKLNKFIIENKSKANFSLNALNSLRQYTPVYSSDIIAEAVRFTLNG